MELVLVKGLVGAYELIAHQTIEIITQEDEDALIGPILASLAEHVVEGIPAITAETLLPDPVDAQAGQPVITSNNGNEKACPECGAMGNLRRSGYCSERCYQRAYRRKWDAKKKASQPKTTAAPEPASSAQSNGASSTADPAPAVLFGHNANHLPVQHGAIKGRKLG